MPLITINDDQIRAAKENVDSDLRWLLSDNDVDLDVQIAQQLRALEEAADQDDTIFEVESDTTAEELAKMRLNAEI